MPADIDPPMSSERSRRSRRAVITDDSYGDGGYMDRDEPSAGGGERDMARAVAAAAGKSRRGRSRAESSTPAKRAAAPRTPRAPGAGVVWRLAALATLLWIGGVVAFSIGFFRLPVSPIEALPKAALALPPHLLLMTGAVLIAPLGLIWLSALTARRAAALRQETDRLAAQLVSGGIGAAAGGESRDPSRMRAEAEAAARAIADVEASLIAAEERAQLARDRLQTEREALHRLLEDVERQSGRISGALERGGLGRAAESAGAGRATAGMGDAGRTMGLEPSSMLAGAKEATRGKTAMAKEPLVATPPPPSPRASEFDEESYAEQDYGDDDYADEEDEFAPALAPERRSPADSEGLMAREVGRSGSQLDQIDALRRRVQGGGRGADSPEPQPAKPVAAAAAATATTAGALDWNKLVKAANFPESEEDQETLDALYAVLTDPEAAALLQSAEDALSALADAGLYMEDMQPHHAPTELWRAYVVDGQRRDVMDLGGVRDPHAIEDATEALRGKPEFSAVAERFMDRYETVVERLFAEAPEPTMAVELADTRSGRAYMLLARASGRFG